MRVLRRFPVSDEFNSDRKTFCVISDRIGIFEISVSIIRENANFSRNVWKCRKSHPAFNRTSPGWLWDQDAV